MSILRFIRLGALVSVGLALAASIHVTAEESKSPAAGAAEKPAPATSAEKGAAATSPEVTVRADRIAGRLPEQPPRQKGRTIRCWQYGRLILEEPVISGGRPEGQAYDFKQPGNGKGLQLIDLRSGGVCLIGPAAQ
jgi:hypothetical protein